MDEIESDMIIRKIARTLRESELPYMEFSGKCGYMIIDEYPLDLLSVKRMRREDPSEVQHYSFKINATFIPKPEEEEL